MKVLRLYGGFECLLYLYVPFTLVTDVPSVRGLMHRFISLSFIVVSLSFLLGRGCIVSYF